MKMMTVVVAAAVKEHFPSLFFFLLDLICINGFAAEVVSSSLLVFRQ